MSVPDFAQRSRRRIPSSCALSGRDSKGRKRETQHPGSDMLCQYWTAQLECLGCYDVSTGQRILDA
eukprot:3011965-Rhodomonas_salina.8